MTRCEAAREWHFDGPMAFSDMNSHELKDPAQQEAVWRLQRAIDWVNSVFSEAREDCED